MHLRTCMPLRAARPKHAHKQPRARTRLSHSLLFWLWGGVMRVCNVGSGLLTCGTQSHCLEHTRFHLACSRAHQLQACARKLRRGPDASKCTGLAPALAALRAFMHARGGSCILLGLGTRECFAHTTVTPPHTVLLPPGPTTHSLYSHS